VHAILAGAAASAGVALGTWLVSLRLRDASIADVAWGWLFVAGAGAAMLTHGTCSPRAWLALGLVSVWALRLSVHLLVRGLARGAEDRRYAAMRARVGPRFGLVSLFSVFLLQAALATIVGLPVLASVTSRTRLGWLDAAGAAIWLAGVAIEAVADAQLARFAGDPSTRGQVLKTGLWSRSRHPNYFGEALLWWGLGLVGVGGCAWWSLAGPLVMTLLLLRVSGVSLLEQTIGERRPGYADYVRTTPAFIPKIFRR
jgi:steroid 5-alpha reductase family enzyme